MTHAAPKRAAERQRLADAEAEVQWARAIFNQLENLHRPFGIYDECDHSAGEHEMGAAVVDCVDFETCLEPSYFICAHCCRDASGVQTEECAANHLHDVDGSVCATAAIILGGGS